MLLMLPVLVAVAGLVGDEHSPLQETLPTAFQRLLISNDDAILPMTELKIRHPGDKTWSVNLLMKKILPSFDMLVNIRLGRPGDCVRDIELVLSDGTTSDYPRVDLCVNFDFNWTDSTTGDD